MSWRCVEREAKGGLGLVGDGVKVICTTVAVVLADHEVVTVYDVITTLLGNVCVLLPIGCDGRRHVKRSPAAR